MPNRLAQESSPYLLQHQDNPVDWYPWGEEALARARAENKPILLSVGYSACHWCHVMAHESFENPEIAELMNRNFINIKVDREERPDLDQIYQNVAQAITRSGGWPLTVFLTPDLKPFFGGTYFPPSDKYGRAGFPRVLQALSEAYRSDTEGVAGNAQKLSEFIASVGSLGPKLGSGPLPSLDDLEKIGEVLPRAIDWRSGGLGEAPKFPNSMMLDFLWRISQVTVGEKSEIAKRGVILSLTKMAQGGIYDQLGGGFHRYSVDATWSVPHFEKMLYDNGLLLRTYAQVVLSGDPAISEEELSLFKGVLKQTIDYVLREMTSPEGVFYAAQDADSEGEEGKFFVWDPAEIRTHLSGDEFRALTLFYGVTESGNFEHGKTVLYRAQSLEEVAGKIGRSVDQTRELIDEASRKLLEIRDRRVRPGTDTKVLASWNGLMISGLAWAAQALEKGGSENQDGERSTARRAREAASRAFGFILDRMSREGNRLSSSFQGGVSKHGAYLDDYAFLSLAALDISRFSRDPAEIDRALSTAEGWMDVVLKHFGDEESAGFFFTSDDHEKLIQRPKTIYDQAIPAGTSVALECMAALAEIDRGGRGGRFAEELDRQLASLFPQVAERPYGYGELIGAALLRAMGPVVVSGRDASELIDHPHVFQKAADPAQGDAVLVCHRKTCGLPHSTARKARGEVSSKLGLKLMA